MRQNGIILYRGKSVLDGAPIVVILTGIARKSKNPKTGDMLQTWIIREDVPPTEAILTGEDSSICGTCVLRGILGKSRACYVTIARAPLAVWKAYKRGSYGNEVATAEDVLSAVTGRAVRAGSYGDPVAAPFATWRPVWNGARTWTGYTHAWREPKAKPFRPYIMASVETLRQARSAWNHDWRTFRTAAAPLRGSEVGCPAAVENGARTTCEHCSLCRGARILAKSITIQPHGGGARFVPSKA